MKHAEALIERILFLDGTPNLTELMKLNIGQNVKEQLESDLKLEVDAVRCTTAFVGICRDEGDNASRRTVRTAAQGRRRARGLARSADAPDQGNGLRAVSQPADKRRRQVNSAAGGGRTVPPVPAFVASRPASSESKEALKRSQGAYVHREEGCLMGKLFLAGLLFTSFTPSLFAQAAAASGELRGQHFGSFGRRHFGRRWFSAINTGHGVPPGRENQ